MRFLSLFSGIEAASTAWNPLGWEAVAFSEIEPFPCKLLSARFPTIPNLGDVSEITEEQVASLGHVDVVVGGFPCQDLSAAGERKGLYDAETGEKTRSGLFFDGMRVVEWARKHCGARWLLIENVRGLFSSNKKRDFAAVVGAMAGCAIDPPEGRWPNSGVALGRDALVEWAVLDAQFFGVPQRRRRIFALADFGDWSSRGPILLERESLRGDTPKGREARQDVAPTISARTKGGGGLGTDFDLDGGLVVHDPAAYDMRGRDGGAQMEGPHDTVNIRASSGGSSRSYVVESRVRRLTPRECERCQGFPDDFTKLDPDTADQPRYRAIGNSMAVPVMTWIGRRMQGS